MEFLVHNVRIKVDFLFVASVTFLLCFDTGDEIRYGILFSIIHEFGHLFAIVLCGEYPQMIRFGIFGMTILRKNDITQDYKKEFITAISGPMMNFFLFIVFYFLFYIFRSTNILTVAIINLIIGLFNITPVFSLDGGRALESILKMKFCEEKSEEILKIVSLICLSIMMGIGFYILIKSKYNFTLLAISVYLMITVFIKC